jgi:hypothetical protein
MTPDRWLQGTEVMKAKIFEVAPHMLPSGRAPAVAFEERLNDFLARHPGLHPVTTHMSALVVPAEPNVKPWSEESSIILFYTLFYTEQSTGKKNTSDAVCTS